MSIYLKISMVGRDENLLNIFFQNGNKNQGRHKKSGSVGLAETRLFFRPYLSFPTTFNLKRLGLIHEKKK